VVTVEEAKGLQTEFGNRRRMQFDRGYLSPYFVTNQDRMECVLDQPLILLHEKKISAMRDLLPILEQAAGGGRPLLIVAQILRADALATLSSISAATIKSGRPPPAACSRMGSRSRIAEIFFSCSRINGWSNTHSIRS